MAAGESLYRARVEQTLRNLGKPRYVNGWGRGQGGNIDEVADSVEGGIYCLNRLPVPEVLAWVDREMASNVVRSAEPLETAKLLGTMKLESNGVRTVLMHALMHTRGLLARPWQQGLALGAAEAEQTLAIVIRSDKPWSGRLVFDVPRHRLYMGFARDWPRMNTLPEWFTVEPERSYVVRDLRAGTESTFTGEQLHHGLPLELKGGEAVRLLVSPAPAPPTRASP
jgi:hypothetical protein